MQQPVFFMYLQGDLVVKTQYREKFLCIQHSSSAYVILNFLHDFTFFPALLNCMGKVTVAVGRITQPFFYAHKIILLLSNSKLDLKSVFTRQIHAVL